MKLFIRSGLMSLLTLLFLSTNSYGQTTVSGTVTGDQGEALIGVSILIQGTGSGTVTDAEGEYTITAQESDVLVFSYTGYGTVTRTVGTNSVIDVELQAGAQLDEVVVTALGISRERKALGYAVEELNSEEIVQSRQNNLVNALQGQVAGVQVSSAGGGPGQASRIIIRGINSLDPDANNEPLFVIDGIPVSNETLTVGGGGSRNVSNRIADINPQDIETMTVLKGGPATALYGLRAANGAIIITTKSGKSGRVSVDVTSTYGTEEVNKFPETQKTYTQGFAGNYDPNSFWPSWGPSVEEARAFAAENGLPRPNDLFNNFENAYTQGDQWRNTVSVSGGNEKATFRTSLSRLTHDGVLPFSTYDNTSFRINANYQASEKFSFGGGVNYIRSGGNRVNADRFNERLVYWAPQADVNNYIREDGSMIGYRNDGTVGNNPVYGEATNKFIDDVDRYIGNLTFSYSPLPQLRINYTLGLDQYSDFRNNYGQGSVYAGAPNFEDNLSNGNGFVVETSIRRRDVTSNINAIYTSDLTPDLNLRFLGGFDAFDSSYDGVTTIGNDLDIYNLFSLNNAADIRTSAALVNRRLLGLYGELSLAYQNAVYLSVTGRNDWSSTLPQANRSFFYPSVSLGVLLGEVLELPELISFAKLRASYAGIGKDTDPYRTNIVYRNATGFPINNVTGWTRDDQQGAPDLKPERTNTLEFGADLRFLNNRLGIDFTYYNAKSIDQIIPVPVSNATGFSTFVLNAGSMRNSGVELALRGTPISTADLTWNVNLNYTSNKNEVLTIFEGVEDILIGSSFGYAGSSASIRLIRGEPYGNIYGRSYARYDPSGDNEDNLFIDYSQPLLIGDDGFPVIETEQKILGNTQPKWFGALTNNINYKGIGVSFQFDTRQGVQKYNQQGNFFAAFGTAPYTLNRNETIVFEGVTADGSPNTKPVWLGQGEGPDGENYGAGYYRNRYRGSTENFVEDADWFRLRNVSLSYQLPAALLETVFIRTAGITLTGNNLWLETPYSGFDPEGNRGNGNGDDGFGGFTYPSVRSIFVTLNLGF
ncbi:TonB-linked SusC/RagA family outer membrane protein [Lewinella aquimaris]|uniref:TonB-linked SusC/RagA family outer membrane protein n=1 Tax=Neolewinella aquimaris TaxID=1835722 RepID=A0A840ECU4_9BACT|nr:SusC/RagA family TonB-linked outer membrane protein [Neolewinella aquimaris]MBB4079798.1 TonB-linked SusC/RagA family outer membrane protein [Neolewinella aquimaris]